MILCVTMKLTTTIKKDGGGGGEGGQKWFLELSQALPGSLKESEKKIFPSILFFQLGMGNTGFVSSYFLLGEA